MTPAGRHLRWLAAGVLSLTALAATAAESPRDDRPEIELLLHLDLLREADLTGDQRVVGRGRLEERLRLLELLRRLEPPAPAAPASREGQ